MKGKYNGQAQWQTSLHDSLPTSWRIERVKSIASKIGSGITPKGGAVTYQDNGIPLLRSQNIHFNGIRLDDVAYITQETHDMMSNSKVYTGDVLLNITGASIGRCSYAHSEIKEANVNQHVCIIRPGNKVVTKYLCYFLSSSLGQKQIFSSFTGSSREGLSIREIGQFRLVIPLSNEQLAIAAYLDKTCAAIDKSIEAKQKQLEILDALRKSIINKAVTRGLDDSVELKDSGVEWLGRIPRHWDVRRIKSVADIRYGVGQPPAQKDDGIPMVRATNVNAGKITDRDLIYIDPRELSPGRNPYLKEGEIIVVRSGAYTGDSAIIPKQYAGAVAGYDMVVTATQAESRFLAYSLLSAYVLNSQIFLLTLRAAQPHLNAHELGGVRLSLPETRMEQKGICDYLDLKLAELARITANIDAQISTLKQYRKSLIHECVTGKRRVTDDDVQNQL